MKIKKFVARDFQAAIKQAKAEMGGEAIILHSRQVKKRGLLAWFSAPYVEITVAIDNDLMVNSDRYRKKTPPPEDNADAANNVKPERDEELLLELRSMKNLITDLKSRMYELERIGGMSEQLQVLYEILTENHVDREIALNIVSSVASTLAAETDAAEDRIIELFVSAIQGYINCISPITINSDRKGTIVFLVGPTGVGKTTTIAKLAANMTFLENRDIGLITLDTYRISAAEQLRTFAEIIGISISVVFNPADLCHAIDKFKNKDLIFVDTAGRSPYNRQQMEELKEFVQVAKPDETILVLSITTESSDLINMYQEFSTVGIDKVIFTKLDETRHYGPIINVIQEINKPIAYFTTGQNVPDDIEVPNSFKLAHLLLRRDGA